MRQILFLSSFVLLVFFGSAAAAEKRVALVVGNGAYANAPRLPNPRNDAEDVSVALKRVGFDVIAGVDLDKAGMDNAAIRFARAARDADVAVFYYSGHAMQFAGTNYLMPIDAKLADEADLRLMVRADSIVADLQQARNLRILVLDSCRDNPLAEELKRSIGRSRAAGISRGLAPTVTAEGMIVAYATQAGRTADDGTGRNSPYTAAFLKHIEQADEIGTIFRRISADVYETTKRTQFPELSLSFIGEFYLKDRPALVVAPDADVAKAREAETAKAEAARAREIAALQEKLSAMQEQLNKRDALPVAPPAIVSPPPAPAPKQIIVAPSVPAPPAVLNEPLKSQQAVVTPSAQPLPPAQAPVAAGAPFKLLRGIKGPSGFSRNSNFDPKVHIAPLATASRMLAALGKDGEFRQWDIETGASVRASQIDVGTVGPDRIAFSSNGARMAISRFTDTFVYKGVETKTSAIDLEWKDQEKSRWGCTGDAIAFSPDGRIVAKAYPVSSIRFFEAATGKAIRTLLALDRKVCGINSAAFTPDGRHLLTSTYRLFEVATGKLVRTLVDIDRTPDVETNDQTELSMSADGRRVALATPGKVGVWDIQSGKPVWKVASFNERASGGSIAYSADSRFVVAARRGNTGKIHVYDANTGQEVQVLSTTSETTGIVISPDSRRMMSSHVGGIINVWDITDSAVVSRR